MRTRIYTIVCTITMIFFLSGIANATPANLYDILGGDMNLQNYTDSFAPAAKLTDTDGTADDSTFFLFLESAGYAPDNTFGIYGFTYNPDGSVVLGDSLEVFNGSASAITSATVSFNIATETATCDGTSATIGTTFGFYLTTPQDNGYTYYLHTSLNIDGFDHFMLFDTSDNAVGSLLGADLMVAMEDLYDGGDKDYNDMVVGISDVAPAPVPEPATLLLIGSGLLGMGAFRRKKDKV